MIRTKDVEGILYYSVHDIGKVAGIKNAFRDVRDEEPPNLLLLEYDTKGGRQQMLFCTAEIYDRLVRKQEAREKKRLQ
jgi:hypothetical protein